MLNRAWREFAVSGGRHDLRRLDAAIGSTAGVLDAGERHGALMDDRSNNTAVGLGARRM
jgi:hypothetical protein